MKHPIRWFLIFALLFSVGSSFFVIRANASAQSENPLFAAWEMAKEHGAYRFNSDVIQTTTPLATLGNVGRSSRTDELHLQGNTDLHAKSMFLQLWSQGGSAIDPKSALEVKVEDGKTLVRQAGGAWQDKGDLTGSIAPNGDFMTFLAGMKDVKELGQETRGNFTFTRYSFRVDGPAVAAYVRDQAQTAMTQRGELPPGMSLDTPAYYAQMTGNGELWIDDRGLPLRQTLHLAFPPQRDEVVTGEIVTTFSDYKELEIGDWRLGDWEISSTLQSAIRNSQSAIPSFLLPLLGLSFVLLVILQRRSRKLCAALSITVILSQVSVPLASTLRIVSFVDAQSARAAAVDQEVTQQDQMQQTLDQLAQAQTFDPLADPVQVAAAQAKAQTALANEGGLPALPEANFPEPLTAPNTAQDSDADGLTDFLEERIGTSMTISDTDGDLVLDGLEVLGFTLAGKKWHSDPLARDSNSDGQPDTTEWRLDVNKDNLPDDTDADGVPDLFDNDNDNDGINDAFDLSPYTKHQKAANQLFNESNPFNYQLNNLEAGKPVFIDFQIRPKNDRHLWYAMSVLDWPHDVEGQIQDGDDKTFADVSSANDSNNAAIDNPADANGDLKLIPMLEVRMDAASANLPGADDLLAYSTSVNDLSEGGARKVAYVPLRVINDTKSGSRVAFQARLPYKATGIWSTPHEARLVWVVQALLDLCIEQVDGICVTYDGQNQPEVIQSYYDEWSLTGFALREDHGTNSALIYEDPTVDNNLKDDAALMGLAYVLDNTFLMGRDIDNNNQVDMPLTEVARRFDRLGNGNVPLADRYGLSNTLRVQTNNYPTLDMALMTTAMTHTKQLLDSNFRSQWQADNSLKPVFLFAQENRYRAQSLDSLVSGTGISNNNGTLLVDLKPGGVQTPVETSVGLKLSMFCAPNGSEPIWQGCDMPTLWDELFDRYAATARLAGDSALIGQARMGLIRMFFVVLAQGVANIIMQGTTITVVRDGFEFDTTITAKIAGVGKGVAGIASLVASIATTNMELIPNVVIKQISEFGAKEFVGGLGIGGIILTKLTKLWESSTKAKVGIVGTIVGLVVVALVAIGLLTALLITNESARNTVIDKILPIALPIVVAILPVVSLIGQAIQIAQVFRGLEFSVGASGAFTKIFTGSAALSGTTRASLVIGAVIQLAVVWGIFIYQMVDSKVSVFSPEFNRALAQVIAATILIIILTVLSATVIGLIIVTVIALIDGILTAICELGVDALRTVPGFDGACFTLNTAATVVLTKLLYSYDSMIDTDRGDLITTAGPEVTLLNPQRGYVTDNPISVKLPVTTTVVHKNPKTENLMHILPYIFLFSEENIRNSTFIHELSTGKRDLAVELNQMNGQWAVSESHKFAAKSMFRAQSRQDAQANNITLQPGLNKAPDLYLNTGFALPAYECWTIPNPIIPFIPPAFPVCYVRDLKSNSSTSINQLKLDILPATFEGFVAQIDSGNGGMRLNWDLAFTTLKDADGDGLLSPAHNGNDPSDNNADSDGDSLSDLYEMQWQSAGEPISPVSWDTDSDGLSDAQELTLGTSPAIKDSDNDGLSDSEEVYHQVYTFDGNKAVPTANWAGGWTVTVTGTQTLGVIVSSDPSNPDTDSDGVSDQAEKELALHADVKNRLDPDGRPYHPQIVNKNPLLVMVGVNDKDRIVRPGQPVAYSTSVTNLGAPFAAGGLEVRGPAAIVPALHTFKLELDQTKVVTKQANMAVVSNATSQNINLLSFARARLVNPNPVPWKWLPATPGSLGSFTRDTHAVALAPSNYARQDSYVLTSLVRDTDDFPQTTLTPHEVFRGDIGAWSTLNGEFRTLEVDDNNASAMRARSGSDVACTESGKCFYVWDQYDNCRTVTITNFVVNVGEADEVTNDIAIYIQRNGSYLRPGENTVSPFRQLVHKQLNMTTGQSVTINKATEFCGPDVTFVVYEYDSPIETLPDINPPGASLMFNLPRTSFNDNFWTFQGNGSSGTPVRTTLALNQASEQRNVIVGSMTGLTPTQQLKPQYVLAQTANITQNDYSAVVATDGKQFFVAWERVTATGTSGQFTMRSQIVTRRFDADGNPLGSEVVLGTRNVAGPAAFKPKSYTNLDVAWIGDAWRVIWQHRFIGDLEVADFDANGALIANSKRVLRNDIHSFSTGARIAYDPNSGRHIIAYSNAGSLPVGLIATSRSDTGTLITLDSNFATPMVAYHPAARGWLLNLQRFPNSFESKLLNPDGTPMTIAPTQVVTWTKFTAGNIPYDLSCPVVASQPALVLPFEELPGATSFADSSGNNHAATCNSNNFGCPLAGVDGAPGAPLSDFALNFNGVTNQFQVANVKGVTGKTFSAAFWINTSSNTSANAGILQTAQVTVTLQNGKILFKSNAASALSNVSIADGNWHHVVVAQNESKMTIFIDGADRGSATDANTASLTAPFNMTVGTLTGGTFFNGRLDHLMFYDSALDQATATALMNRTLGTFCMAAATVNDSPNPSFVQTMRLNLQEQDVRGGVIKASAGLSLTIDADPPTSTLGSLVNGEHIQGRNGQTLIIGGTAHDKHGIAFVEVSVNNGLFHLAKGAAAWTVALPLTEGAMVIKTRATDIAGNVEANPNTTTVIVDASAPTPTINLSTAFTVRSAMADQLQAAGVTLSDAQLDTPIIQPTRRDDNRWQVSLSGNANDPNNSNAASGISLVEVLLVSTDPVVVGNDWQRANLNNGAWDLTYLFADNLNDVSGPYTVTVRATDSVGNIGIIEQAIDIDSQGPQAQLNNNDATRSVIDTSIVKVGGVVSDVSGVANLEAVYMPIKQVLAYSDTVMLLPFEENSDELWYDDRTTNHYDVTCISQPCLTAEQPGRIGKAVRFNGNGALRLPNVGALDFDANNSLSLHAWVRTTQPDATIVGKQGGGAGYALALQTGKAAWVLNGATIASSGAAINDNQWHHLIGTVDRASGQATLFVDGVAQGSAAFASSLSNNGELQVGGPGYSGFVDEVAVLNAALTPFLAQGIFETPNAVIRNPATLAQPGLPQTTWQAAVPLGLEGQYQLDMLGSDNIFNQSLNGYVWRGIIDTLAPRINYTVEATGKTFVDTAGVSKFEVHYTYAVTDRHLTDLNFTGPCDGISAITRDFAADAEMGGLFPDLTIRNKLSTSCSIWETSSNPGKTVRACDLYDNCLTSSGSVGSAAVASGTVGQSDSRTVGDTTSPLTSYPSINAAAVDAGLGSIVTSPTSGSIVKVRGGKTTIRVVAEGASALKDVVILLDNNPVHTINFAQSENVLKTQQTVEINLGNVSEGNHTLSARASEHSGAVQQTLTPIVVTLDTADPVAGIDNDSLTGVDTFSLGNSIMRIRGKASDTLGLAAVQVRHHNSPFSDVTFDEEGNWSTALFLNDEPAGKTYTFTVRAIDLAGGTTEANKSLVVDLPTLTTIQTTINASPASPTSTTSASISFSGVDTSGNLMSDFLCSLDGSEFTPCASPINYSGLGNGDHIFRVFAHNGTGTIDPSPATAIWTVDTGIVPTPVDTTRKIFLPVVAKGSEVVSRATIDGGTVDGGTVDDETISNLQSPISDLQSPISTSIFLPLVASGEVTSGE